MTDIYVRLRELAVAASGTEITGEERSVMESEYQTLRIESRRIAEVTAYGDHLLLDGTGGSNGNGRFTFQVGYQSDSGARANVQIDSQIDATLHGGSGVKSVAHARAAIDIIDDALQGEGGLHDSRAKIGSSIRTLSTSISFLMEQSSGLLTTIGGRRDLDIAKESAALSQEQVLQNAGVAMLAQANAQPSVALRLLG